MRPWVAASALLLAACEAREDSGPADDTGGAACTDLDCDGWPDLVCAAASNEAFSVTWGSPDGLLDVVYEEVSDTRAVALGDVNLDGLLDVVLSRYENLVWYTDSAVLTTTGLDPWSYEIQYLPTYGAHGVSIADLDRDGWPDVVISNHGDTEQDVRVDSTVFWNDHGAFSADRSTGLPTLGAFANSVADLNGDGWPDIVFSNYHDGEYGEIDSYVYWGSPFGYSTAMRTGLPTLGARGNLVADLDQDGQLDILFTSYFDGETFDLDSRLYLGSSDGFSPDRVVKFRTIGAHTASAADLDDDGWIDVVFSNQRADWEWTIVPPSRIFWGSSSGWSLADSIDLSTRRARGQSVNDVDLDGDLDVVVANFAHGDDELPSVYLYRNDGARISDAVMEELAAIGGDGIASRPGEQGY